MLHFTPVTAESMPLLRPYYETCPYRLCEYSSGVKYMWRGHLRSEYAFTDGCLVIRNCIDGVPQFDYPIPGPEGDVDAALFMVADQPCLSRWSTEGLVSFYLKEPDKIAAMAYGARRGNPVIFPKDMFIELRDLTGDTGGSAVICKNQDKLRLYQVEDELELFDADRAAELERLKREKERTI